MGNLATPEALLARREDICRDPALQDLPYRIELNAWGKVEMSPASVRCNVEAEIAAKTAAYLDAGAQEVWLVAENGSVEFVDRSGKRESSRFMVSI